MHTCKDHTRMVLSNDELKRKPPVEGKTRYDQHARYSTNRPNYLRSLAPKAIKPYVHRAQLPNWKSCKERQNITNNGWTLESYSYQRVKFQSLNYYYYWLHLFILLLLLASSFQSSFFPFSNSHDNNK